MKIPRNFNDRTDFMKNDLSLCETDMDAISPFHTTEQVKNSIENFIGDVKVPLGIAGPLNIKGTSANGSFYIPMSTSEGALVASYSRGMNIINMCGGVETVTYDDYFIRSGMFKISSLQKSLELKRWCQSHESEIREIVLKASSHISIVKIEYDLTGTNFIASFYVTTGDAMGSNMASKACFEASKYIHSQSQLSEYIIAPYPEDKKNIPMRQKGKKVIARTVLDREVMLKKTRVDINKLATFVNDYKSNLALHGSSSLNIHAVNGMAALFQALGQDIAYLGECSQVVVNCSMISKDKLEFVVTLPSLIVGSVGGGTALPSFKASLNIIDCYGAGKVNKLAEIIAATILAGEISCGAALCAHEFVSAHQSMGKNYPSMNSHEMYYVQKEQSEKLGNLGTISS